MIKNIVFDMGGVLIDYKPDYFIQQLNLSEEDKKLLMKEVFNSYKWPLMDFGIYDVEQATFEMQKNVPDRLKKYVKTLVMDWPDFSKPVEGMYELVCELKDKGYDLFLLSNAASNQPEYWKRYPYYFIFDKKIISYEHHIIKPDRDIYQLLTDTYQLDPEECVFIDDVSSNVAGAVVCGWKGIVFNGIDDLRKELKALDVNI